jgi:Zn-dependent metalloprotease
VENLINKDKHMPLMKYTNLGTKEYQTNYRVIGKRNHAHCNFVPPYLIKKHIEQAKSPEQRKKAMFNLQFSAAITRERRLKNTLYGMFMSAGSGRQRMAYDAQHQPFFGTLPGKLVRSEGQSPTKDTDVNNAYDNTGNVFDFYKEVYQRTSIDNNGMPLISSVHVGEDWNNAQWNGTQMLFGDGDGVFFKKNRLTDQVVCAHELTHGVTENESNLEYHDEMGGLNEGLSDIFGIMCAQWVKKQKVDDSSWLIGEDLMVEGGSLRSMKDPGTAFPGDEQISNYKDFDPGMDPHICSGIPNKAFYLTCMEIGGYSWEKAGKIWYIALRDGLKEDTKFVDFANMTLTFAEPLGEDVVKAVRKGWEGVGVKPKAHTIENLIRMRSKFA